MDPTSVDAPVDMPIDKPDDQGGTVPGGRARPVWARRWVTAVALVALMTTGAVACAMELAPPPTARVERATVSLSVTASGALSAVQAQNLGFSTGGQLKELGVKVGDVVQQGQFLARLDDFAAKQALDQAVARRAQAKAQLDRVVNGYTVEGARRDRDAARQVLSATQAQADAANEQADKQVYLAEKDLQAAEQQLDQAQTAFTMAGCTSPPFTGSCKKKQEAVASAQQQVATAKTNLSNARANRELVEENGRVAVANARRSVVQAENSLRSARGTTPADIAAQEAAVRDADAAVRLAQQDLDNTVLIAPIAGTIASINGAPGEFLNPGSQTTPLAPGSDAAIPGVTAAATDAGGSVAGVTAPGGSNFIVLGDVHTFQVVVPFEESDAARVRPGQKTEVTFDALPDLTLAGTVLAVAPSGTAISGVTNYYSTVALTQTDERLRDRQTADVKVLTEAVENVLSVPNPAVVREGGQTFVNVPGPNGESTRVPFEAGLSGDDRTEVKSGLNEGQEVQLPSATVTATPEQQRGPR